MNIGYPCLNYSLDCSAGKTFRLASYSDERLVSTVENNLACLTNILKFNVEHDLLFFRISSDIVPFASHPVCAYDWQGHFKSDLSRIGQYITKHAIRISMHPGQYTLLNSPEKDTVSKSIRELSYHADILDGLGLDETAKIQIHIGGRYGDKQESMKRFISVYKQLPEKITKRLVIENDDVSYSLKDCLSIHQETGMPIVFDTFHHELLNNGESFSEGSTLAKRTWQQKDGHLMIDYSSEQLGVKRGKHTDSIDIDHFAKVLDQIKHTNPDIMLEIKDKEKSAQKAVAHFRGNSILFNQFKLH